MKVLIYGDPHVNKYPQGLISKRRETELSLFHYIYDEIVPQEGIDLCVCLGDFLHNSYIPASDVDYICDILDTIKTKTFILTGNHDRSTTEDTVIGMFSRINPNVTVVRNYQEYYDQEDNLHLLVSHGWLNKLDDDLLRKVTYLYTHEDYKGLIVNTLGYTSKTGYNADDYECKIIFNGHIHHQSTQNFKDKLLFNVGAISPVAFGELEAFKYPTMYILDTKDGSVNANITVNKPILPITCSVTQYPQLRNLYSLCLDRIRLRVTYEDEIPALEGTEDFLSVEYKKLLTESINDNEDITTEVEDVLINVPDYIDEYLEADKNLSTDNKVQVKSMCDQILAKI